jgi:hypothetical protein
MLPIGGQYRGDEDLRWSIPVGGDAATRVLAPRLNIIM